MYSDDDLTQAIRDGVFTEAAVDDFKALVAGKHDSAAVDEENFRLIGSFNDIFVAMACLLLLFSSLWVLKSVSDSESLGLAAFTLLSWYLAEIFVLKRKMALPAIVLLLSFIGGLFAFVVSVFNTQSQASFITAAALSTLAAYGHWWRFRVPITIAAGTAAGLGFFALILLDVFSYSHSALFILLFLSGLLSFSMAMYWDARDTHRTSRHTDVAFWLHLLSAPLIIHPIFASLGVLDGDEKISSIIIVTLLYLLMSVVSIAIDRRAFMFSSLAYVLYAISSLFEAYGGVGYSFALTGVFMGALLLFISAFWQRSRSLVVGRLPASLRRYIPKAQ